MKKISFLMLFCLILTSCNSNTKTTTISSNITETIITSNSDETTTIENNVIETSTQVIESETNIITEEYITKNVENNNMKLYIDNNEVDITWEDNESVLALKDLGDITINMHRYGGFEQVGPIGKTIVSNDISMDTIPGDIVLYSSNQLVIFFGTNSWSYTKLGHINLNTDELIALLDKSNVETNIKVE